MTTHSSSHATPIPEIVETIPNKTIPLGAISPFDHSFDDVNESDWFYADVMYAYQHGLMTGTSTEPLLFSPNTPLTRGMIVAIMYRDTKGSAAEHVNPFNDVVEGKWYTDAVIWAAANGIVSGYGDGKFGPEDEITRQDLACILQRYASFKEIGLPAHRDEHVFDDAVEIADYAKNAIEQLYRAGIIGGKPGNLLDPKGSATRAEFAAMLHRFLNRA